MSNDLMQVIVNVRGKARTVTQKRDALGRFLPGADVSLLTAPNDALSNAKRSGKSVVMVSHSMVGYQQTVMTLNRQTRTGNGVTFSNDGLSKHADSVYTNLLQK